MGYITIGASPAVSSSMVAPYSDGGFEPKLASMSYSGGGAIVHFTASFTNTSGSDRTVREVGHSGTRLVLDINAMANFCVVPNGATVAIDWYYNIYSITPKYVKATLDTSTFTNAAPIHYNAVPLPSASIVGISPALGGKTWEFLCYTDDQADIDNLQIFVSPLSIGTSITGQQYVISSILSGTLFIKDLVTRTKVSYANCFIQSIDIEPMLLGDGGFGQWFTVSVVQSAYADA
jgi:hypothetical protein